MKKIVYLIAALAAVSSSASTVCGHISYSTFDNGATTVRLFTEKTAYTAFSKDDEIDTQLMHLSKKRDVCLTGEINSNLEINVTSIKIK